MPNLHPNGNSPVARQTSRNGLHPAVGVSGVSWSYGDRQVLSGLDFAVQPGTLTALAGPNGAGKSTLFRLIAGVLRPPSGRIQIAGTDVASLSHRDRSRLVAVVPQDPELPRSLRFAVHHIGEMLAGIDPAGARYPLAPPHRMALRLASALEVETLDGTRGGHPLRFFHAIGSECRTLHDVTVAAYLDHTRVDGLET